GPPFQRGLKGMPRGNVEGTPKPIDNRLINFGVKHGKSPSRPCECEQGILSRVRTRSRPERDLTEDSTQGGKPRLGEFPPIPPLSAGARDHRVPPLAVPARPRPGVPGRPAGRRHQDPHPKDPTMGLPSFADEAALFDWVATTLYAAVLSD